MVKKYTSPANEFLIHACGQTDIYLPPLDKCDSPIVSKIGGFNKWTFWSPEPLSTLEMNALINKYKTYNKNWKLKKINGARNKRRIIQQKNQEIKIKLSKT